jgi:hypothetical protein
MYKLIQKAYEIDFSRINEGHQYSSEICHADSLNKAKSILLSRNNCQCLYLSLRSTNDNVTYLTIPVKRCEEADWYEFEGDKKTLFQINKILNERKRIAELELILNDSTIQYCYIKKRGEYYRPNSCGYTSYKYFAGVYTKEDAIDSAKSSDELSIVPIDINIHNEAINNLIVDLQTRLL